MVQRLACSVPLPIYSKPSAKLMAQAAHWAALRLDIDGPGQPTWTCLNIAPSVITFGDGGEGGGGGGNGSGLGG